MADQSKNSRVVWYILFAVITIVMCYLFVVVFFFFISPENISAKLTVWPFSNQQQIANMYHEAMVKVEFSEFDEENLTSSQKTVIGVNVRKDGYVLITSSAIDSMEEGSKLSIYARSGEVFAGKLLWQDEKSNLAVLKCESMKGKEVKLPYVKVSNLENISVGQKVFALSWLDNAFTGKITDTAQYISPIYDTFEGSVVVDYVVEGCMCFEPVNMQGFDEGVVFDSKGHLLGFSNNNVFEDGTFAIYPAHAFNSVFDQIVSAYKNGKTYQNVRVTNLVGFDKEELLCFRDASEENHDLNYFYFNGAFMEYSTEVTNFENSNLQGFFLMQNWQLSDEVTIAQNCVVDSLSISGRTVQTESRLDLLQALYSLKGGQKVSVHYYEIGQMENTPKLVSFVA